MKTNKKIYSVALATIALMLFLFLVLSTSSAATAQSSLPAINETKITTSGSTGFPDIYGDRIVYMDWHDENELSDVYVHNLSTKKETRIPTSGLTGFPKIYGDRIVYSALNMSNGRADIYMYNLSTSKESRITSSGISGFPDIYGDRIVYINSLGGRGDIYLYDLSTKKETPIVVNRYPGIPAIYNDRIVFHEWDSRLLKHSDIKMYNLSTSEEIQINTSGSAVLPAIYGNRIVYYNASHGKPDIYMFDLSTKEETKVTTNETSNGTSNGYGSLAIYGSRIVWLDRPHIEDLQPGGKLCYNIYMYDLSTSNGTKISTSESLINYLAIYGNKIVWSGYNTVPGNIIPGNNSTVDIYMCTVPGENTEPDAEQEPLVKKNESMPGFEVISGIVSLFGVFLYRRR